MSEVYVIVTLDPRGYRLIWTGEVWSQLGTMGREYKTRKGAQTAITHRQENDNQPLAVKQLFARAVVEPREKADDATDTDD